MTVETRTTITLGDLTHVEFECGKCYVRTIRPLSDDTFVPATCPASGCDNKNWFTMGSQEHQDLRTLINLIHRATEPERIRHTKCVSSWKPSKSTLTAGRDPEAPRSKPGSVDHNTYCRGRRPQPRSLIPGIRSHRERVGLGRRCARRGRGLGSNQMGGQEPTSCISPDPRR
jgi:hypothetical protein